MKTVFMLLVMLDDAARHKEWMDEAQDLKEDLREALQAKSRAKSAEPAARLVQIGEQEEEYWRKAKLVDIVKLAQKNLEAARDVVAAAKDGFFDEALLAFRQVRGDLPGLSRRSSGKEAIASKSSRHRDRHRRVLHRRAFRRRYCDRREG